MQSDQQESLGVFVQSVRIYKNLLEYIDFGA